MWTWTRRVCAFVWLWQQPWEAVRNTVPGSVPGPQHQKLDLHKVPGKFVCALKLRSVCCHCMRCSLSLPAGPVGALCRVPMQTLSPRLLGVRLWSPRPANVLPKAPQVLPHLLVH